MDDIPEIGINCFIPTDNYVFVQAGNQGHIYFYNGEKLDRLKAIQGDYANKTMIVHPGSSCVFRGLALFGVSNLSANPCLNGIYSLGQYDRNYPMALNCEYVNSHGKTSSVEVGALLAVGTSFLSAWKDGSSYGVDNISWTAKYASAYLETLLITGNEENSKTFEEYVVEYRSKPASTDVGLSYYTNYGTSASSLTMTDETAYNKLFNKTNLEAGVIQFKLSFTVSANNAPEVRSLFTKWNEHDVL